MSDSPPPANPPWEEDRTVGDALATAADFLASDRTLHHTIRNLKEGRRVIYTVEVKRRADGTYRLDLLVNAANHVISRGKLTLDEDTPTPAPTLSDRA